jgi:hypothetical protein
MPPQQVTYGNEQTWSTTLPNFGLGNLAAPSAGPLSRRHRSMTPHQPMNPAFAGNQWLGGLNRRPTAQSMLGSHLMEEPYQRATSLDPSTLNTRAGLFGQSTTTGLDGLARPPMMSTTAPGNFHPPQPFEGHSVDLGGLDTRLDYNPQDFGLKSAGQKTDVTDEYTNWAQHEG